MIDVDHLNFSFPTLTLDPKTFNPKMETKCVSFTLPQQFIPKYKNHENIDNAEEDLLRTCESSLNAS